MTHIIKKLDGGLLKLHSVDKAAIDWLSNLVTTQFITTS